MPRLLMVNAGMFVTNIGRNTTPIEGLLSKWLPIKPQ